MSSNSSGTFYSVNPDDLTGAAAYTQGQADEINNAVNWITGMANQISAVAWTGPAANTFSDAATALQNGGSAAVTVLNNCATKLNTTAGNYTGTQDANTNNLQVTNTSNGANPSTPARN